MVANLDVLASGEPGRAVEVAALAAEGSEIADQMFSLIATDVLVAV
jgi:hypothetical protein